MSLEVLKQIFYSSDYIKFRKNRDLANKAALFMGIIIMIPGCVIVTYFLMENIFGKDSTPILAAVWNGTLLYVLMVYFISKLDLWSNSRISIWIYKNSNYLFARCLNRKSNYNEFESELKTKFNTFISDSVNKISKLSLPNDEENMNEMVSNYFRNKKFLVECVNRKDLFNRKNKENFVKYESLVLNIFNNSKNINPVSFEPNLEDTKEISPNYKKELDTSSKLPKNIRKFVARKIDWDILNTYKNEIGRIGEQVVLEYEKDKLLNCKLKTLSKQVQHVSKEIGDGLGYDIKSFDINRTPIYIEVKSTTQIYNRDFFISANELRSMQHHKEDYYLYIVSNLNLDNLTFDLEIFKGQKDINACFEYFGQTYKMKRK